MNKTILTGVVSLMLGLASMYLIKPAKLIPSKPYAVQGETVFLSDSTAYNSIKAKYDSVLWELGQAEKEAPPVPDTCKGVVEYWKKQLAGLKTSYSGCQTQLQECVSVKSGSITFADTLDGFLELRGKVLYPEGDVTLTPNYLRKPEFRKPRFAFGAGLPLLDFPWAEASFRWKDTNHWFGVMAQPQLEENQIKSRFGLTWRWQF